jgi:hypothetical protein
VGRPRGGDSTEIQSRRPLRRRGPPRVMVKTCGTGSDRESTPRADRSPVWTSSGRRRQGCSTPHRLDQTRSRGRAHYRVRAVPTCSGTWRATPTGSAGSRSVPTRAGGRAPFQAHTWEASPCATTTRPVLRTYGPATRTSRSIGRATSPEGFKSLLGDVERKILDRLPDETCVYPGYGNDTTLGERPPLFGVALAGWWS